MRFFVTVLFLLVATAKLALAEDSYRSMPVSALKWMSPARVFISKVAKYQSIDELSHYERRYLLTPGETLSQDGWSMTGSEHKVGYDADHVKILQLGYVPLSGFDNPFGQGWEWQDGKPLVKKWDKTKPMCMIEVPTIMSNFAYNRDEEKVPTEVTPWPAMQVEVAKINHSSTVFTASVLLTQKDSRLVFTTTCFVPPSWKEFTVGQLEDTFGNQISFKESEFVNYTPGNAETSLSPDELKDIGVQVLKPIPHGNGKWAAVTIQNGDVIQEGKKEGYNRVNQNLPYCAVDDSKGTELTHKISKEPISGKITQSNGDEDSQMMLDFHLLMRVTSKNGHVSNFIRAIDKNYGNFSLWCSLNRGADRPSLADLNNITQRYIRFVQQAPSNKAPQLKSRNFEDSL